MCLALQVAQLAERHHNIKPNFGLHPWYNPFTQLWQRLFNPFLAPPVSLEAGMRQAALSFVLLLQVFAGQIRQLARQLAQTARGSTSGRSGRGMSGH